MNKTKMTVIHLLAAMSLAVMLVASLPRLGAKAEPIPAPILVVVNDAYAGNRFGRYLGEILRAEGLNAYTVMDLSAVTAGELAQHSLTTLAETSLTSAQAGLFTTYVNGGGRLLAMRPDGQIAGLFGLGTAAGSLVDGYVKIQNSASWNGQQPGSGLTVAALQIHGTASRYTLGGGGVMLAELYSNRTSGTGYPAVVGASHGRAAAFTYDLARNVVYTRQGNPANANVDVDGDGILRTIDLFQSVGGGAPWVDREVIPVPQADEQQRLFARLVRQMVGMEKPLPQLWYFGGAEKTVLVTTADAHANPTSYYQNEINTLNDYGAKGTFYITIAGDPSDSSMQGWRSQGHEFGIHPYAYAPNSYPPYNITSLAQGYDVYDNWWSSRFSSPKSRTVRNHQVAWLGWTDAAELAIAKGIALDTNFYHWGVWLKKADNTWPHGYITGSGQPMKFVKSDGTILNEYQLLTELVDEHLLVGFGLENLDTNGAIAVSRQMIDASQGGDYAALMTQFHVDYFGTAQGWIQGTLDYARSLGIPRWNADTYLAFTEVRHDANYTDINWNSATGTLTFTLQAGTGTPGLTTMLPRYYQGLELSSVSVDGAPATATYQTVKGVDMVFVRTTAGNHTFSAVYQAPGPTRTPTATITGILPTSTSTQPAATPTLTQPPVLPTATLTATPVATTFPGGFPSTGILDNFNRANGSLGANWSGSIGGYAIANNQLDVGTGGDIYWSASSFGPNQEVFMKLVNIDQASIEIDLLLKSQSATTHTALIEVWYDAPGRRAQVWTFSGSQGWVQRGADIPVTLTNGDQFGARATADGKVSVYQNGVLLGTRDVTAWPHYASGGYIGLWFYNSSATLVDDFGGGNVTAVPTQTATVTPTATALPTSTPTSTASLTLVNTITATATSAPGNTSTPTLAATASNTPLPTFTQTATATDTLVPIYTPTPTSGPAAVIPRVAIHVSELTRALMDLPAGMGTPSGVGTTGKEWWVSEWKYYVMFQALKEALKSDGTPFIEITDAEISAGGLLTSNGTPRYPILISLAGEAIQDNEISQLRQYVAAGGFLLAGSSAFTRYPDGRTRGDFALASEMGLHMSNASLSNWYQNGAFTKVVNHRLVDHIPSGTLSWRLPLSGDQIPLGTYPDYVAHQYHLAWGVNNAGAQVLATGSQGPLLTVKGYGNGQMIYYGVMQPLIGHGGYDVGMYSYVILRRAIEWAFESQGLPMVKLSPWRYEYDAALVVRHDVENWASVIAEIDQSAQWEQSRGARGDYYLTTGTVRLGSEDTQLTEQQKSEVIARLRTAIALYGATIGSHNGGLRNPGSSSLPATDYSYWHWGPDEALDRTPTGFSSGGAYAQASLQQSFMDIEGWFIGLDNGRVGCGAAGNCPRTWVSPFFNSTREGSYAILEGLGVKTGGEQKLGVLPHWTVSTEVEGKLWGIVSLPTNEWYINDVIQALDDHTNQTIDAAVDFYYSLGGLLNIYTHYGSHTDAKTQRYILRSLSKPRVWSANAVGVYDWWVVRSPVVVSPTYSRTGNEVRVLAQVSGATDAETAIEMVLPGWARGEVLNLQVYMNGALAGSGSYRTTGYGVKVKVGAGNNQVEVRYTVDNLATATPAPVTATPTSTVTPEKVGTFPTTGVLDDFNRADGAMGSNWSGKTSGYGIVSNQLDVGSGGDIYWQAAPYGPDQEVYLTLAGIDGAGVEQDLLLKSQGTLGFNSGVIEVIYDAANRRVQVWTYAASQGWVQRGADIPVTFVNGDQFGARSTADGKVHVYRNGALLGTRDVTGWPYAASGGYIGLWFINSSGSLLDDFGGGNVVSIATSTATSTAQMPVATASNTPLPSSTATALPTNTSTLVATASNTPLPTSTPTVTFTSTPLPTNTPTATFTNTPLPTNTPTATATNTSIPMFTTGFLSPSANNAVTASSGDNNGFEVSPGNAYLNDGVYAVDNNSGTNTSTSCTNSGKDRHIFYDYSFNLVGATAIQGIEVTLDGKADSTSGAPRYCVQLSWNGGANWTAAKATGTLGTTDTTFILGGPADTWGRAWTIAQLSNANFRVRVISVASNTSRDFSLDWIAVQVTYR